VLQFAFLLPLHSSASVPAGSLTAFCVVDGDGRVVWEAKLITDPPVIRGEAAAGHERSVAQAPFSYPIDYAYNVASLMECVLVVTPALIEVRDVHKQFRSGGMLTRKRTRAVDGVSLELPGDRPSILAIIGESGSGKSTLGRLLLNVHQPDTGQILLRGRSVSKWRKDEFLRTIQPVFQNPFEAFSLHKPVDFYLHRTAINLGGARTLDQAREIASKSLHAVGLNPQQVAGKFMQQFSGGELQRIAIARALISHPKLIVADEPVSMVDASLRTNIVNLFLTLKRELGISFVYITHDLSTAYYVADALVIMYQGRIVESGNPHTILRGPRHEYTRALLDAVPRIGQRWDAA
jgi:peptide/nickel transport system ATP-binding protein